jgi:hypothetical protein
MPKKAAVIMRPACVVLWGTAGGRACQSPCPPHPQKSTPTRHICKHDDDVELALVLARAAGTYCGVVVGCVRDERRISRRTAFPSSSCRPPTPCMPWGRPVIIGLPPSLYFLSSLLQTTFYALHSHLHAFPPA